MKRMVAIMTAAGFLALTLSGCNMREEDISSSIAVNPAPSTDSMITDSAGSNTDSATSDSGSVGDSSVLNTGDNLQDDSTADQDSYAVEVENRTGSDIYGLQYSMTGSEEWGEDYASDMLADGDTATLNIPRGDDGERFDLRGYDNEEMTGVGWVFPEIDFTQDGRLILDFKDDEPNHQYE